MEVLTSHPSARLEYWFFKFNAGRTALLVDWICRRSAQASELRVSIHSPTGREVLSFPLPHLLDQAPRELTLDRTSWADGEVLWNLELTPGASRIRPQLFPADALGVFDMSLVSVPDVSFNGWVEHRGNRYPVSDGSGMLSHYWGRQLPPNWWWLSANRFDTDLSLECTFLHTHIWGTPLQAPLGYLYYRRGPKSRLLIAPPARIRVTGSPESFQLAVTPFRGPSIALKATARDYASLGERIVNTLVGDLQVYEEGELVGTAFGTAGLERRTASA